MSMSLTKGSRFGLHGLGARLGSNLAVTLNWGAPHLVWPNIANIINLLECFQGANVARPRTWQLIRFCVSCSFACLLYNSVISTADMVAMSPYNVVLSMKLWPARPLALAMSMTCGIRCPMDILMPSGFILLHYRAWLPAHSPRAWFLLGRISVTDTIS